MRNIPYTTTSNNASIGKGKKQFVAGSADEAAIKSGGSQIIFGGGISTSATVYSGGVQVVESATLNQKNTLGIKFLSSYDYTGRVSGGAVVWKEHWEDTWETGLARVDGGSLYYSGDFSGGIYGVPYSASAVYSGGKITVTGKIQGMFNGASLNLTINNKSITGTASADRNGWHIVETIKYVDDYLIETGIGTSGGYSQSVYDSVYFPDYNYYYIRFSSAAQVFDTALNALSGKGIANKTEILAGGKQIVTSGNTGSTTIYGKQYLKTKAVDKAAAIYKGGIQYVSKGATANAAKLYLGGKQHVYNGGKTAKTTVYSGGIEYVHSGGIASATKVAKGGNLIVSAGGKAKGLTLAAKGKTTIQGGSLTGTAKLNGGTLTIKKTGNTAYKLALKETAVISYDIRSVKTGAGAMFSLSNKATANNSFSVVVSKSQAKGSYKLSSNLSVAKGTEFTIKVGSKAIGTAKLGKAALVNNGISYSISKKADVVTLKLGTASKVGNAIAKRVAGWPQVAKSITYSGTTAIGNYLSSASPSLSATSSGQSIALKQAGLASVS